MLFKDIGNTLSLVDLANKAFEIKTQSKVKKDILYI